MRFSRGFLACVSTICIMLALGCHTITLASQHYPGVLLFALASMMFADRCCVILFRRGGHWRWVAVLVAAPSVFILWDFARRASYLFS